MPVKNAILESAEPSSDAKFSQKRALTIAKFSNSTGLSSLTDAVKSNDKNFFSSFLPSTTNACLIVDISALRLNAAEFV